MSPKKKTARLSRCKVKQEHVTLLDWKDNDLLTRQEAAAYAKVCVRTLTKWVQLKKLPELRIEGVNRIPFGELKKFLATKNSLPKPNEPETPSDEQSLRQIEDTEKEMHRECWNNLGYQNVAPKSCFADFSFEGVQRWMKENEADDRKRLEGE